VRAGALFVINAADVTVVDSHFENCSGKDGGALAVNDVNALTVDETTFVTNAVSRDLRGGPPRCQL